MSTPIAVFKYTDDHSAYNDSNVDLALGFAYQQVGSNRKFKTPCFAYVNDQRGNAYCAYVTEPVSHGVWKQKDGGKPWKYVYKAQPISKCISGAAHVHPQFTSIANREAAFNEVMSKEV